MPRATVLHGIHLDLSKLNFPYSVHEAAEYMEETVKKLSSEKLEFSTDPNDYSPLMDGFVGVPIEKVWGEYGNRGSGAGFDLEHVEKAQQRFEDFISSSPEFFTKLKKEYPGIEFSSKQGKNFFILQAYNEGNAAAELYHGYHGDLSWSDQWEVRIDGKHNIDLKALNDKLKENKYLLKFDGDHESKFAVIDFVKEKLGASMLINTSTIFDNDFQKNCYWEFDLYFGQRIAAFVESSDYKAIKFTKFTDKSRRFYIVCETYGHV